MRERKIWQEYNIDGSRVFAIVNSPLYIMSLTEDWTPHTGPVEWGLECIGRKLNDIDSYNPYSTINQMDNINGKIDEEKKRSFANETEFFLKEFRPQFAKSFDGVNTSNLTKIDKRRLKDGNY